MERLMRVARALPVWMLAAAAAVVLAALLTALALGLRRRAFRRELEQLVTSGSPKQAAELRRRCGEDRLYRLSGLIERSRRGSGVTSTWPFAFTVK